MLLLSRIENRHILWTSLSLVAIGMILPGGFGVKPPLWFHDQLPRDVETFRAAETEQPDTTTSVVTLNLSPKVGHDLVPDGPIPNLPKQAQPSSSETNQAKTNLVNVPLKFAKHIPPKHFELTGNAQKQSFIELLLPLVLAANDELLQRREAIRTAVQANDRDTLDRWAVLYRIDAKNFGDNELADRLLHRIDTIPVGLALAQAAIESGWGTSRFARQGNALFGQWAWTDSAGMRPLAASNDHAVVRSFGSLLESVRAYMHNLNTHQNYKRFRDARYSLKPQAEEVKAIRLAAYLDSYAEIGQAYVKKLLAVMSSNNFDKYAEAKLG